MRPYPPNGNANEREGPGAFVSSTGPDRSSVITMEISLTPETADKLIRLGLEKLLNGA